MMQLIFKNPDNTVALVCPAPDYDGALQDLAQMVVPPNTPWRLTAVPDAPQDRWRWADEGPLPLAQSPAATLPREAFCVRLIGAGILSEDEAVEAALGAWPPKFEPALAGKALVEVLTIKNLWRETKTVARDAPLFLDLLAFYAHTRGYDTAQMMQLGDQIFAQTEGNEFAQGM